MKIVDVAEYYAPEGGGIRTYINHKLRSGRAAGHEVVVIAPGPEDRTEAVQGGRIHWVRGPSMPFDDRYSVLWNERKVHALLDAERPDVVEASSVWSGGWFVARWPGRAIRTLLFHQDAVAVFPHTLFDRVLPARRIDQAFTAYWLMLRRLSAHFDATVVAGEWLAQRLRGFGARHPVAIPFGIDTAHFRADRADPAVKRALLARCGVGPDADLILNVSRLHPEKRLGTVLEAFNRARGRRPMGLVVYGQGMLQGWVERRAARIPGVCLAGYTRDRDEMAAVMASADAMLHGSAAETYGLVVAEAICAGTPVVVPNVGGAADLADPAHSETYTPGRPGQAAAALLRLLGRDRAALAEGCRAARDRIGTMDDHFVHLFEHYEQLVAERS
jgi:alpha-1,6-mannosyltransferase